MSHIDTLKVYRQYKAAGFSDDVATSQTEILENSFMTKVKELKDDFASQKVASLMYWILGVMLTTIITLNVFTLNKVWDLSKEVNVLSHDMVEVKSKLK